jgi:hypothetical protein
MADGGGGGFDGGGGGSGGGGGNSSGKIVELRIHSSRRRKVVWARFSACEDVEGPGRRSAKKDLRVCSKFGDLY